MNTKLLLVSLLMALSAISMPVMAQGTPTEVNISDTKQTITVGDNGINFYDEGGPTGPTHLERAKKNELVKLHLCQKILLKRLWLIH